ncbi:hypothetical protein HY02_08425 [Peptococcaceae bacterium SCADC1_2_3]|jgi:outer membrane protein assembly factor BamB|nr:hypothetical protein DK28_0214470 [Peptococcaceae bacterium SCADC1_2_3]KFI38111.1 hypothetical protein HY02_08425 [Peptococcaceae bacterium SCADC1_2_3]
MLFRHKKLLCLLTAVTFFFTTVSPALAATARALGTSLKPQLELLHEIPLGNVSADKIPDVTGKSWGSGIPFTEQVVSPDGKYVLVVEADKMVLYSVGSGKQVWQKMTYGGVDNHEMVNDRVFLTEKYSYGKKKEHSYITCLDIKTGKELWKYDVQKDLKPLVSKYMPADAPPSWWGYLEIVIHGDKLILVGYNSWKKKERADRVEVLLALSHQGKLLWKVNSYGYPGITCMSRIGLIGGKLVTGTYSYGEKITGQAYAHAFNLNTGEKLWKFEVKNDPSMNYSEKVNVAVDVAGDKVVAVTNFGKVYVLNSNGEKIRDFTAFKPIVHKGITVCTSVFAGVLGSGNTVVLAPGKTYVKGATSYYAKPPVEHPDANSIMVFDLGGNLQWKFRLGGQASGRLIKNNYLIFSTTHNADTLDYSYTGVYVFDLSQPGKGEVKKSVLDRYLGYYHTDGAVNSATKVSASDDGRIIATATWPTRVGTKKYGKHALYILRLK